MFLLLLCIIFLFYKYKQVRWVFVVCVERKVDREEVQRLKAALLLSLLMSKMALSQNAVQEKTLLRERFFKP